jgi:hypothetical protein
LQAAITNGPLSRRLAMPESIGEPKATINLVA